MTSHLHTEDCTVIYIPSHITNVLGRSLPVERTWPDGSWECPHCGYGYDPARDKCKDQAMGYRTDCTSDELPAEQRGIHCQNPACFANPHYPVEEALARLAEHARCKAEDAARQRNHESARQCITDGKIARNARLAEIRAEAIGKGCCVRCALKDAPYRVKYVKHRVKCPLER